MTGALVYLDYQVTTPIDPQVRKAMMPFLGDLFGNPPLERSQLRLGGGAADQGRTGERCSLRPVK